MGATLLISVGELAASKRYFDAALAAYDEDHPQRSALGSDLGVFTTRGRRTRCGCSATRTPRSTHADHAIALAQRRDHSTARRWRSPMRRSCTRCALDTARVLACAEAAVGLCERYGFAYYGDWARVLIGWARGQSEPAEGVGIIEAALERLDANRAQARRPYYLSLLARNVRASRRSRRGAGRFSIVAIEMALDRGDVWWLPALYLQRSEFERYPRAKRWSARAGAGTGTAQPGARTADSRRLDHGLAAGC